MITTTLRISLLPLPGVGILERGAWPRVGFHAVESKARKINLARVSFVVAGVCAGVRGTRRAGSLDLNVEGSKRILYRSYQYGYK